MKFKILAIALAATTLSATSQVAIDAYRMSPTQLRGTARFVGMGGAFTSLGADLSCINQNPAGLGLYRHSEIGLTFDVSIASSKATSGATSVSSDKTRFNFDNIGYVGAFKLNSGMKYFQWGLSYSRVAQFDRRTRGTIGNIGNSLSNYVASYTNGTPANALLTGTGNNHYNPYYDEYYDEATGQSFYPDWLSTLAYASYMINTDGNETTYAGLFDRNYGTSGTAYFDTRERGYQDEYSIDFAGNVQDIVYWGLGVGIVDMSYTRESYYREQLANAAVYDREGDGIVPGDADADIYSRGQTSGSGANLKFGLIIQPMDMLRIGAAIHTPTWMNLSHTGYGDTSYSYGPYSTGSRPYLNGDDTTPYYDYNTRLDQPWRYMIGASVVLGGQAIISADYEHVAYPDMKLRVHEYDLWGGDSYSSNAEAEQDVKNYFKGANIVRLGIEYRPLSSLSLRAGFNWQGSSVKPGVSNGGTEIFTSGTDTSYEFYGSTKGCSLGIGYRFKSWYIDATWQYTHVGGTYHAFTPYAGATDSPSASLSNTRNNVIISTGFKF